MLAIQATPDVATIVRRGVAMPHLRAWRLWAGLSRDDLATLAGITGITVRNAEHADWLVYRPTARRLAAALSIPADVLLYCTPTDGKAERWAREVAVRFAHDRMTRYEPARPFSLIGGHARYSKKPTKPRKSQE